MSVLLRVLGGVRTAAESHRVTTFELFFDLVFVFAITQVTAFMVAEHSVTGVGRGILVLALVWWSWVGYAWLGNQSHADHGVIRTGMTVAACAVFVVALTIPEAWADLPGGLDGPVVLAVAYAVVRVVHVTTYAIAALDDRQLRRQIGLSGMFLSVGPVLLISGAVVGGSWQAVLWVLGLAVEVAGTYLSSRGGNWRINSAAHWTERHSLVVILALGESIVAIGVGASKLPISTEVIVAAVSGVLLSLALWWLYFDVVARAAEAALERLDGQARVLLAIEAFSYLHFPLIVGIVVTALGVEQVLAHATQDESLGRFAAGALCGGVALYLVGHGVFWKRIGQGWNVIRLALALVLVAAWPMLAALRPVPALVVVVVVVWAAVGLEIVVFRERRASLRGAPV